MEIKQIKNLKNKFKIKRSKKRNSQFYLFNFLLGLIAGATITILLTAVLLLSGTINFGSAGFSGQDKEVSAYLRFKQIKEDLIPTGVPTVYGAELNISFDQVQDAINKVAPLDPTYGQQKINLTGQDLERYINIGSQTACKYCCGAATLVMEDGVAACGCEHSQMMRGLAAYLIKNHSEMSDEQILKELNTWRITYFPKQTLTEKLAEMEKAGEPGIKELLEEFPEFLPQMVGGC